MRVTFRVINSLLLSTSLLVFSLTFEGMAYAADQNGDGALDLYQVWHNRSLSGHVEVKVFSGISFAITISEYMTPEP